MLACPFYIVDQDRMLFDMARKKVFTPMVSEGSSLAHLLDGHVKAVKCGSSGTAEAGQTVFCLADLLVKVLDFCK